MFFSLESMSESFKSVVSSFIVLHQNLLGEKKDVLALERMKLLSHKTTNDKI